MLERNFSKDEQPFQHQSVNPSQAIIEVELRYGGQNGCEDPSGAPQGTEANISDASVQGNSTPPELLNEGHGFRSVMSE